MQKKKAAALRVGDHTPQVVQVSVKVEASVLLSVIEAEKCSNGGEIFDHATCCSVCGAHGRVLSFGRSFHQIRAIEKAAQLLC
jgi:hypothetical protein